MQTVYPDHDDGNGLKGNKQANPEDSHSEAKVSSGSVGSIWQWLFQTGNESQVMKGFKNPNKCYSKAKLKRDRKIQVKWTFRELQFLGIKIENT